MTTSRTRTDRSRANFRAIARELHAESQAEIDVAILNGERAIHIETKAGDHLSCDPPQCTAVTMTGEGRLEVGGTCIVRAYERSRVDVHECGIVYASGVLGCTPTVVLAADESTVYVIGPNVHVLADPGVAIHDYGHEEVTIKGGVVIKHPIPPPRPPTRH
ncbi:MAG: hypothetical protein Q4D96_09290 [Propionibacteriaceae bacterium]|nr:hypothetical protein [Propionibacteriaceae bacterium]